MNNKISTTSGLIATISDIQSKKLEYERLIMKLEIELEESDLVRRIMKWKELLKEVKEKEIEIKKQGIEILNKAWIKQFEWNWVNVSVKSSAGRLIIEDESKIPEEYKETVIKETIKIDKKEIKENIKLWEVIEGVKIEQDVSLVVKFK